MGSADEPLLTAAVALGVVTETGDLNPAFFEAPLAVIGRMLRDRRRRDALIRSLDGLLASDEATMSAAGATVDLRSYPLLPDDLAGQLYLTALVQPAAAVTFGLEGRFDDEATTLSIDVPLLRAAGDDRDPVMVTGTADGPVAVRLAHVTEAVTVELAAAAWMEEQTAAGRFTVRIGGLTLDGEPLDDLVLSSDELSEGAVNAVVRIVRLVLGALSATTNEIVALLADHLPPVLGFDDATDPPIPLAELADDPQALRRWLAALCADQQRLHDWFDHLGRLLGDAAPEITGELPSAAKPWTVTLLDEQTGPRLLLEAWLHTSGSDQRLALGLVTRFAEADGTVAFDVRAQLLDLPLAGPDPVRLLPSGSAVLRAPAGDGSLIDNQLDTQIGAFLAGLVWDATGVRPVLEIHRVRLPGMGAPIDRLDLTDADALADTVQAEARAFLLEKLGAPGEIAASVLTLTGLDGGTPGLDLAGLAASPVQAIADFHRRAVIGGEWRTRLLPALGTMLGADPAASPSGPVEGPWTVRLLGDDAAHLDLVVAAGVGGQNGDRARLDIGLTTGAKTTLPDPAGGAVPAADEPTSQIETTVTLARFDLTPAGATQTTLLPSVGVDVGVVGLDVLLPDELPLRATSWTGEFTWRPGQATEFASRLAGLILWLPDRDAPIDLGEVRLTAQPDLAMPDLGLGIAPDALRTLLAYLAEVAVRAVIAAEDEVAQVAVDLVSALIAALPADLTSLLDDPWLVVRVLLADPFAPGSPAAPVADDILRGLAALFAGTDGSGTPAEPWSRALDQVLRLTTVLAPASIVPLDVTADPSPASSDASALIRSWEPAELGDRVARLAEILSDGDGLVRYDMSLPEHLLPNLLVPACHADVVAHPAAIAALTAWLADLRTGDPAVPLAVVVPGLLGAGRLRALLAAVADDAPVSLIDLSPVAGGSDPLDVTRYPKAPVHVVIADDARPEQLAIILDHLAQQHPGHPLGLVAVSFAAPAVLAVVAARPAGWAVVATVADPTDGTRADADIPELADVVRLLLALDLPLDDARAALEVVAALLDGWRVDDAGVPIPVATPAPPPEPQPRTDPADPAEPALAALRIGGLVGDGLAEAVDQCLAVVPGSQAPTALVFGLGVDLLGQDLTEAADGPRVSADIRLDLIAIGRTGTPALHVIVRVDRPDGYLLTSSPATGSTPLASIQVGALELDLHADLAAGTASGRIELLDTAVRGVRRARVTPLDAAFRSCLDAVVQVLAAADESRSRVRALLDWLADDLALIVRSDHAVGIAGQALAALTSDPVTWLADRARTVLLPPAPTGAGTGGTKVDLFGLVPDPTAPSGTRRWTWSAPEAPVRVVLTDAPWTLRVETSRPLGFSGLPGVDGLLQIEGALTTQLGQPSEVELAIHVGELTVRRTADGTIELRDPLLDAPLVLSDKGGPPPEDLAARLVGPLGALLGARLIATVLDALTDGRAPPARTIAALLIDPARVLHDAVRSAPELAGDLLVELARALGFGVSGTEIELAPDLLSLDVAQIGGRAALTLRNPEPLRPDPAVGLSLAAVLAIDADRHVHPGLAAALGLTLPAAADAWGRIGIRFAVDEDGPRIVLDLDGTPMEIVPHFAGLGALVGPVLSRLLPRTLDLIVDETPDTPVRDGVLAVARALELYGTSFADAPTQLGDLTVDHLVAHAATAVPPIVNLIGLVAGTSLPAGTIVATPDGRGVTVTPGAVLDGTLAITVGFDPVAVTVALAKARLGPVVGGVSVTAGADPPSLGGAVDIGLDLSDAIGLTPRPTLRFAVATSGAVSLTFEPLGAQHTSDLLVTFLPTPTIKLTDDGGFLLVEHILLLPGVHAIVLLLGDAVEQELWAGGPSLRALLHGALLLQDSGAVAEELPEPLDLVAGAGSVLLGQAQIELSDQLDLGFGTPDETIGPTLAGYVPFDLDQVELRLLLGTADPAGQVLAVDVLRRIANAWQLAPRLRIRHTGMAALGAAGQDLVTGDIVRLGGVEAAIGFDVELDLSGSGPEFEVRNWQAYAGLLRVSLPILGGGGEASNPVASGMLASTDGKSVQPQFDLSVSWDGTALHITLVGGEPDEPVWFPIDRTFGPLHIARIGVQAGVDDFGGRDLDFVALLIEGAISMAGLGVSVRGLGIRVPLVYLTAPEHWQFELDGLAVSYQNSSVTIVGGLLKQGSGITTQYLGMLQVTVSGRGITALGGYSRTSDGEPSLFAFVVINVPIGGPPYLFITGLAGGFGYNRRLIVPTDPERIPTFPLMAALAGRLAGDPSTPDGAIAVLEDMATSIPPQKGSIWLAAGIKFTTFALLETNALLYLQFGNGGFEIGLLGLMGARLPSADNILVTIELALLARYSTADNMLIARAQLTRNSWLFTPDCRVTGGFAFIVWFDRPQAMLSIGGYHPDYPAPADYPVVPRVGFSWTPTKGVVVKGESYFTLTPEAAMTGGRLEARAEIDGVGYGELIVYLDALLWFEPPRFVLDFGLRVKGRAFGFSFNLGANVHIELPPVYVFVHVDFLWGFDIFFGTKPAPTYLNFDEYAAKFLGAAGDVCSLAIADGPAASDRPPDPDTVGRTADNPLRVLPEFELVSAAKFPALGATWAGGVVAGSGLGVNSYRLVPLGPFGGAYRPTHVVTARREDDGTAVGSALVATVEPVGVPSAVYWDDARGPLPAQDGMGVDYSDMTQMVAGVRLRAESTVVSATSLGQIVIADIVDEPAPLPLPDLPRPATPPAPPVPQPVRARRGVAHSVASPFSAAVPRLARRGRREPTPVEPVGAAARPVVRPFRAWSSAAGAVTRIQGTAPPAPTGSTPARRRSAARSTSDSPAAPHPPVDLELWQTPGRWQLSSSRVVRIRQLDAVGRVIADGRADRRARALDPLTELVAVQPREQPATGPVPGAAGWQLHTRAHPVAPSAFLARTAGVATSSPTPLRRGRTPADGVEMFWIVTGCTAVVTDLPAEVTAVLVQLDPIDPLGVHGIDDVEVSAGPDGLTGLVRQPPVPSGPVPSEPDGRRQLVFAVTGDVGARSTTSITVTLRSGTDTPPRWMIAGVVGAPTTPGVLAAAVADDPQVELVSDPTPESTAASLPRPRFTPVEADDG